MELEPPWELLLGHVHVSEGLNLFAELAELLIDFLEVRRHFVRDDLHGVAQVDVVAELPDLARVALDVDGVDGGGLGLLHDADREPVDLVVVHLGGAACVLPREPERAVELRHVLEPLQVVDERQLRVLLEVDFAGRALSELAVVRLQLRVAGEDAGLVEQAEVLVLQSRLALAAELVVVPEVFQLHLVLREVDVAHDAGDAAERLHGLQVLDEYLLLLQVLGDDRQQNLDRAHQRRGHVRHHQADEQHDDLDDAQLLQEIGHQHQTHGDHQRDDAERLDERQNVPFQRALRRHLLPRDQQNLPEDRAVTDIDHDAPRRALHARRALEQDVRRLQRRIELHALHLLALVLRLARQAAAVHQQVFAALHDANVTRNALVLPYAHDVARHQLLLADHHLQAVPHHAHVLRLLELEAPQDPARVPLLREAQVRREEHHAVDHQS